MASDPRPKIPGLGLGCCASNRPTLPIRWWIQWNSQRLLRTSVPERRSRELFPGRSLEGLMNFIASFRFFFLLESKVILMKMFFFILFFCSICTWCFRMIHCCHWMNGCSTLKLIHCRLKRTQCTDVTDNVTLRFKAPRNEFQQIFPNHKKIKL